MSHKVLSDTPLNLLIIQNPHTNVFLAAEIIDVIGMNVKSQRSDIS